jgi:hypothetical protein
MMTIVYDLSPDQLDLNNTVMRRRLGSDAAKYLIGLQEEIRREHLNLGGSTQFSIGIDYSLVLTNKPKDADIALTVGPDGRTLGKVEVPKDPSRTHPYRQKELIEQVNEMLDGEATINQHDVQCVRKAHKIDKRPEFHYVSGIKGAPKQFSHGFADWMVQRFGQDADFSRTPARKPEPYKEGKLDVQSAERI